jgi:hypothetical protein
MTRLLPDLADWSAIRQHIREWRWVHYIHHTVQPEVSVSADGCEGLDLGDAVLADAYMDTLLASSNQFQEVVAAQWVARR